MSSKPHSSSSSGLREAPQGSENDYMEDDDLGNLPAHVRLVRDGLLDFNHFMGLQAAMLITEETGEDVIPLSAYKPDGQGKLERARESEFVESAQHLAAYAQNVDAHDKYEWHKLFRAVMTERIDSARCGSNMLNSIAWADNETWLATTPLDLHKPPTTIPIPCLCFGFYIQEVEKRAETGFRNDPSFGSYTREQLAKLTTHGLRCELHVSSSIDEIMAQTTSKEPQPQSVCFPWGIFEAHGVFQSSEANDISLASLISQVSAAASTALSMFESLAKFADEKHGGQHIPPVIVITSVGASTKVWLAYCDLVDDKIRDHKMISIWDGTITRIWDAIQFCRIIDNLFFWARYCLKPKVTQYLSQWRLRYCPDVPKIHSLLEEDTRTAKIVHRIQDRLGSLGLSPNEDLPSLVRQAVVFQEVMRSSKKKAKAGLASKEERKLPATTISLPSPPNDSTLEATLSSSTGSRQGTNPKIRQKEKEILHQDGDFVAGKSEKSTSESSKPHDTHIPKLQSSPRHQKPSLVVPDKGQESTNEIAAVLEDVKATSTKLLTNKLTFNLKSPTISETGRRVNNEASFSNPRQIKTLSAEEEKTLLPRLLKEQEDANLNFVQRTLRSMASRVENGHVLSLAKQKRRNSDLIFVRGKPLNLKHPSDSLPMNYPDKENIIDRPSSSPNPFISAPFALSFQAMPWLDLDMTRPRLTVKHRHGPYPTLCVGSVEYTEYPRRTALLSEFRRMIFEQRTITTESPPPPPPPPPPASLLKVKIPWKDKYIMVRLPPVSPASPSIKSKSDP